MAGQVLFAAQNAAEEAPRIRSVVPDRERKKHDSSAGSRGTEACCRHLLFQQKGLRSGLGSAACYAALVLAGFKPWKAENLRSRTDTGLTGGCLSFRAYGINASACRKLFTVPVFPWRGMFLARKRQAIRSPKQTWALRDSVPCDDGECGSAALRAPQQSVSVRLSF